MTTETQIAKDFVKFLYGLYDKHPELRSREIFITGESYAGHYVPAIASELIRDK